ncbi:MAG: hypothetical protein OXT69_00155 [Candidatus Poribacteria bacterium]|nr:hypothetical protein [Candidatus Poribacteria bacterium]
MRGHAIFIPIGGVLIPPPYPLTLSHPDGWEGWIPTATETIVFTAETDLSHPGFASVSFHLSEVTSYEGRYMNDLLQTGITTPDLYFAAAEQQQTLYDGQITWTGGGENSTLITASWQRKPSHDGIVIPVNIVCNDYAAYGKIRASLYVPTYTLPKVTEPQTIPKDDGSYEIHRGSGTLLEGVAGNKLADEWDRDHLYWYGSSTIMDTQTADRFTEEQTWRDRDQAGEWRQFGANSGDGFTVLEEYRGFMVGGSYTRLHPEYKDVFIRSEVGPSDEFPNISEGETGYASSLPMSMHFIDEAEWDGVHVNFCQGGIVGFLQRPIIIEEDRSPIPEGVLWVVFGETPGPGWPEPYTPNNSDCVIYTVRIAAFYNNDADAILPIIIAHEAGHAVNLEHHSLVFNDVGDVAFPVADSDVCVMVNPVDAATYIRWAGMGYAHTHNTPPGGDPPDADDWENHHSKYKLHSNHEGQLTYDQY